MRCLTSSALTARPLPSTRRITPCPNASPRREKLVTVVAYAFERRVAAGKPDHWDYATQLELAVLARDEQAAMTALADALASVREVGA